MEIRYQTTRADLKAFYAEFFRHQKASQRRVYYQNALWYLAVLGVATYIALKHGEVFVACMFAVLAAFYIKQAWSFEQRWNAQAEEHANTIPESSSHLVFDQAGATERFSGIQLSVPWSEIHDYTLQEDRLFIHFLTHRAFIIPFRYLSVSEREELKETLEQNHVRKRT